MTYLDINSFLYRGIPLSSLSPRSLIKGERAWVKWPPPPSPPPTAVQSLQTMSACSTEEEKDSVGLICIAAQMAFEVCSWCIICWALASFPENEANRFVLLMTLHMSVAMGTTYIHSEIQWIFGCNSVRPSQQYPHKWYYNRIPPPLICRGAIVRWLCLRWRNSWNRVLMHSKCSLLSGSTALTQP